MTTPDPQTIDSASTVRSSERGQGMVEYALILMLIAIVVIVTLLILGKQTNNLFSNVSSGLGT